MALKSRFLNGPGQSAAAQLKRDLAALEAPDSNTIHRILGIAPHVFASRSSAARSSASGSAESRAEPPGGSGISFGASSTGHRWDAISEQRFLLLASLRTWVGYIVTCFFINPALISNGILEEVS